MRAPSPDASERVDLSRRDVPLAHGNPGSLGSADFARDDTKKRQRGFRLPAD